MTIDLQYIPEPKLQFGHYFDHEDSKTGLAEFGPFGKNVPGLHPSEIKLGFVGTRETIAGAKDWIGQCSGEIESENVKFEKVEQPVPGDGEAGNLFGPGVLGSVTPAAEVIKRLYKILNRDFIGFCPDSPWKCQFVLNDRWDQVLRPQDIDRILAHEEKKTRIEELIKLLEDSIRSLAQTRPTPDIIILALTPEMVEQADTVRVAGNFFLNLRRAVKARAMKWKVPIQLLQRSTVLGKKAKGSKGRLQEKATRAWNFCTALYYKADGVPWRPTSLAQDTCFVGIDFFVAQELGNKLTMRSSVAQAFDHLGQGLVLRGDPFEWDEREHGRSPHLTTEEARKLIRRTLEEYVRVRGQAPRRVVIHKSSRFWGTEHREHNELEDLYRGIEEVQRNIETDFVTLAQTGLRLFREGMYPPLRGTCFDIGDQHFLYTMGFIPYLQTYPGHYPPEPWELVERHGGSAPRELFKEVLELTKMNVNNCSFADGVPITLSFADKVGEIMKHIPEGDPVETGYKFYM
jgi:hypothetical protein